MKTPSEWEYDDPQRAFDSDYEKEDWDRFVKAIQSDSRNSSLTEAADIAAAHSNLQDAIKDILASRNTKIE